MPGIIPSSSLNFVDPSLPQMQPIATAITLKPVRFLTGYLLFLSLGFILLGQFLGHVDANRCIERRGLSYGQCRALNG